MEGPRIALHTLRGAAGASKQAIRVGRGRSSRRGKTAGRGHKGQGQHAANRVRLGFEGGQTPLYRRQPKRGFTNPFSMEFEPLNLSKLQTFIEREKLDPSKPIDMRMLLESGAIGKPVDGVKLLGAGPDKFPFPINIEVSRASKSAIAAIEAGGGTVTCAYYSKLGLRALLHPERFAVQPRRARPPRKLEEYYSKPEHRGYIAERPHGEAILHRFQALSMKTDAEEEAASAAAATSA